MKLATDSFHHPKKHLCVPLGKQKMTQEDQDPFVISLNSFSPGIHKFERLLFHGGSEIQKCACF
ncbi:hypothetical protein HanPI659440_Chr03g0133651 [Helianthus annuus]|nr:hypothetical protein HanPI659440_Chr03g0133651 [Helianthus annuus]